MFRERSGLSGRLSAAIFWLIMLAAGWVLFTPLGQAGAQAAPKSGSGQPQTILTIVFRDSIGNPLEGVITEVLSYDWGLPIGQAYAVIARGETDKNGVVAFDNSRWPYSGYRVKFTPTAHIKPANSYFLPDSENQYRGYPGITTGGITETQKFVLSGSDGLAYNDLSKEGELPEYQRDPVGGLVKPRVSVMPGKDFLATVLAATATAEARGEPTPTLPPPAAPSPRPGEIQSALIVTPGAALTAASVTTQVSDSKAANPDPTAPAQPATTSVAVAQADLSPAHATGSPTGSSQTGRTPAPAFGQTPAVPTQVSPSSSGNLLVSILLAVFGLACLILFLKFRQRIYPLLGIAANPNPGQPQRKSRPARAKPAANPGPAVGQADQKPEPMDSQSNDKK